MKRSIYFEGATFGQTLQARTCYVQLITHASLRVIKENVIIILRNGCEKNQNLSIKALGSLYWGGSSLGLNIFYFVQYICLCTIFFLKKRIVILYHQKVKQNCILSMLFKALI